MVKTQFGHNVKIVKSDNGSGFVNEFLQGELRKQDIVFKTSAPYNPEQNGKAEREIRT